MRVYLHELQESDHELDFTESEAWIKKLLDSVDEKDESISIPGRPKKEFERPSQIHFNLRKVDETIIVSGDIDTKVRLLCSRCAAPFDYKIQDHFTALYTKDKEMAGVAYLDGKENPRGTTKGFARHAHDYNQVSGTEANADLEIGYIPEEYLELADVLAEQIHLRIPFQPLCKETCKGICSNCGADLNVGRCACAKLKSKSPFSVLKDFKTSTRDSK